MTTDHLSNTFGDIDLDDPDLDAVKRGAAVELRACQTAWMEAYKVWQNLAANRARLVYRAWRAGWTLAEIGKMIGKKYHADVREIINQYEARHAID